MGFRMSTELNAFLPSVSHCTKYNNIQCWCCLIGKMAEPPSFPRGGGGGVRKVRYGSAGGVWSQRSRRQTMFCVWIMSLCCSFLLLFFYSTLTTRSLLHETRSSPESEPQRKNGHSKRDICTQSKWKIILKTKNITLFSSSFFFFWLSMNNMRGLRNRLEAFMGCLSSFLYLFWATFSVSLANTVKWGKFCDAQNAVYE